MRVHRTIIMNDRDTLDMKRDKAIFSHNGACVMAIKDDALAGITLLKDIAIFFECSDSLVIRNLNNIHVLNWTEGRGLVER